MIKWLFITGNKVDAFTKEGMVRTYAWICITGCLLVFISACDRPFVEPNVPEIELIEPENTNRIFFNQTVVVKAMATSFREVDFLEIDEERMHFDESEGVWVDTLTLQPGVNSILIKAFDVEGVESEQELLLPFMRPRYEDQAPRLPAPRRLGGHTATLLQDGSVLVTGGSSRRNGEAFATAYILPPNGTVFGEAEASMDQGRFGHTASLLPDGRVLILGGSTAGNLQSTSQLVQTALVFDPFLQDFEEIPFSLPEFLPPFRRSGHVTFISETDGQVFVDVYGGEGASTEGVLDQLDEIITFRLARDTLFFVDVVQGVDGVPPSDYLASTTLSQTQEFDQARYLVSGTKFLEAGRSPVNFTIDFERLPITLDLLSEMVTPRVRHSSTLLDDGLVYIFGGAQGTITSVIGSAEVYFDPTQSFFTLDNRVSTAPRHSHTATKLPSGRILILGGFNRLGDAIPESRYFDWR